MYLKRCFDVSLDLNIAPTQGLQPLKAHSTDLAIRKHLKLSVADSPTQLLKSKATAALKLLPFCRGF